MSLTNPPEGLSACGVSQRGGRHLPRLARRRDWEKGQQTAFLPGQLGIPLTKDLLFSSLAGGIQVRPERDFPEAQADSGAGSLPDSTKPPLEMSVPPPCS